MKITPVILSGGSGTRLWPLSTNEKPKQFLPLVSNYTMIQETLLRLKGLELNAPIVSCNENHRFLVAEQLSEVCDKKPTIILEPVAKNTAPAIAAACFSAMKNDKDGVVAVFPSDHVIFDIKKFQKAVLIASENAMNGSLVTFGIIPTFASTGYGYIKTSGEEKDGAFTLEKFVEKPCLEVAKEYLASGQYSWNSGMFVFKASTFVEELNQFNPEMYKLTKQSFENSTVDSDFIRLEKSSFEQIKGDSIDYAVMEKTSKGKVVKLDAGWNDVGSWSALWDIQRKDENKNVIHGSVIAIDTKGSYIRTETKTVATIGLDNIVIVNSENAILIASKDRIQDVKLAATKFNKQAL